MSNLPKLSNRAKLALDVLSNGGRFVERLERNSYTGREQFHTRLLSERHNVMPGVGLKAFYELKNAGFLCMAGGNTSVSTYWKLNTVAY